MTVDQLPTYALDEEAVCSVLWFFGHPGGWAPDWFRLALLEAMSRADEQNMGRLACGFPAEAFWVSVLKDRDDGLMLAARALDLLGVTRPGGLSG